MITTAGQPHNKVSVGDFKASVARILSIETDDDNINKL